jgi:hypothetical protein
VRSISSSMACFISTAPWVGIICAARRTASVGRRRIDAELRADLPINLGGRYLFSTSFVERPTVFGRGAEMQVRKFEVRSRVAGTSDGDRHGDQPT